MQHRSSLTALLSDLSCFLGCDPDDLLDAYGTGEAIVIMNGQRTALLGFAYTIPLSRPGDRGLHYLRAYRVIHTIWTSTDLDHAHSAALGKRMLSELLGRLRTKTTFLATDVVALLDECDTANIGDVDKRVRYRLMDVLKIRRANEDALRIACAQTVGVAPSTMEEPNHGVGIRISNGPPMEHNQHTF